MKKTISTFFAALLLCVTGILTPLYTQQTERANAANAEAISKPVAAESNLSDNTKDEQINLVTTEQEESIKKPINQLEFDIKSESVNLNDEIKAELKSESIVNYYYEESGVTVSNINYKNNVIEVDFKADEGLGKLDIFVEDKDSNWEKTSLFTYTINEKSFASSQSEDDAWYKAMLYNYEEGSMTLNEIQKNYSVFSRRDIIEEIFTDDNKSQEDMSSEFLGREAIENENTRNNVISKVTIEKATYVYGVIKWQTSTGDYLPLRNTRIDLFDDEPIGNTYLATTKTDDDGYYSFTFSNDDGFWELGGYDVFIRCYPDSSSFQIARDWALPESTFYNFDSSVTLNVSTGSRTTINLTITYNENNNINSSFYIAQGMIVAQNFAYAMGFRAKRMLNVVYPFTDDYVAFCYDKYAGIGKPYFNDFDTVMHEYGHFVEGEMGNYGSNLIDIILYDPNHYSDKDHFDDKDNKQFAMHLTWSEAWATAFAQIAQEYYKNYYKGKVKGFGDITDRKNYETYTPVPASCEAQEDAVIAFLWDLYDSYSSTDTSSNSRLELYDNVEWGYSKWWKATTKSGTKTISKFLKNIEEDYPSERSQIGELLGAHQIAPSNLNIDNVSLVSTKVAPQLSWQINGSIKNPNNMFKIAFYNSKSEQMYEISSIFPSLSQYEKYTYTISSNDWKNVLEKFSGTATINIAVKGFNTRGGYESGPFISKYATLEVNLQNTKELKITSGNRYTEDIVCIERGQYFEYLITFTSSCSRVIQTFGDKDTYLYLYSNNGDLLMSNDDAGYNLNALISYDFSANTQYKIRVKFYGSSQSGLVKLAIVPMYKIPTYENNVKLSENCSSLRTYVFLNRVDLIIYETSISKTVTCYTESDIDTYLYVIDPRSTKPISLLGSEPSTYNDDGAGNLQAKIKKTLDANVPYLIILSAFNPSTTTGEVLLTFSYS